MLQGLSLVELSQSRRLLRMNTPLGRDKLYAANVAADEALSELFRFTVSAFSVGAPIAQDQLLGRPLVASVAALADPQRHFHGIVESVVLRSVDESRGRFHYEIRCVPWLWFLTRHQDCRIFQDKSVVEIAEEIFGDFGFSDYRWKLTEQPPARTYCVQYRETSFAFLSRLFEEEGLFYYFEHTGDRHTLVVGDSDLAYAPLPGGAQLAYRRLEMGDTDAGLSDWRNERRLHPQATALRDYNFETPNADLGVEIETLHASESQPGLQVYDYPGRYAEQGRGSELARRRMEAAEVPGHTATARGNVIGLGAGSEFSLTGHPDSSVDGTYVAVAVRHDAANNWDEADLGAGYGQVLRAMPTARAYRPPRRTPKPVVEGPQTAVVTGRQGEEIDVDKYGRIKVQFHWDRRASGDERSSCRIRVAQSWAGARWGGMVLPRIGMEVVVEFLEGDPDRPLVTGCVVNADNMPPYALPDERTKTSFRTNSSPGGGGFNELRFEDKKGEEQVFLRAEKDLHLRVQNQMRELIQGDHHRRIERNSFNRIEESRHWLVEADSSERIHGERSEEVGESYQLKVGADLLSKAGGEVVLEAASKITLKVAGSCVVISPDGVAVKGPLVRINSGGSPSGQSASPEAPERPEDPVEAEGGEAGEPPAARQLQPARPDPGAVAQIAALREACTTGACFVENCR